MPLPIDYKIDKIIKEIQTKLKEEGKDISYDTIYKCINHQVNSLSEGMREGDTIIWKYFGSFVATKKRVEGLNKTYEKVGKAPTLEDKGLIRLSFNRKGILIAEKPFEPISKKDL